MGLLPADSVGGGGRIMAETKPAHTPSPESVQHDLLREASSAGGQWLRKPVALWLPEGGQRRGGGRRAAPLFRPRSSSSSSVLTSVPSSWLQFEISERYSLLLSGVTASTWVWLYRWVYVWSRFGLIVCSGQSESTYFTHKSAYLLYF